jgi:hypothetical protein
MATSGQFSCPPLGSFYWPLTGYPLRFEESCRITPERQHAQVGRRELIDEPEEAELFVSGRRARPDRVDDAVPQRIEFLALMRALCCTSRV